MRSFRRPTFSKLIPSAVLRRVTDPSVLLAGIERYLAMDDNDLFRATENCLRNLERLQDLTSPDGDLQLVLVPELWERIRPGTRNGLRRISTVMAEYTPNPASIFARLLSSEMAERWRMEAIDLRERVARASVLDVEALVEQVRFAIAGSRAASRWSPADFVYEPGFVYRLVPAVAWRALVQRC